MHAVFLDTQTFSNDIDFNDISRQIDEVTYFALTSPDEIIERCLDADVVITNKVVLDSNVISALPNLKLICVAATGTNNIDLETAKARGIAVTNAAGYAGPSVAQYIISQLLSYYQQIDHHNHNVASGLWQKSATFCLHGNPIEELSGKTLGLIGYGHIAEHLANIANAFGMKVLISEHNGASTLRAGRSSFDEVVSASDIISLHCPLNDDTYHLVNQHFLANMKSTAVLVNTARGQIIDLIALNHALKNNTIAYAILDVLDQEPPAANHPLLTQKLKNLKVTAHIAWASQQAQQRLISIIAENISAFSQRQLKNRIV